MISYFASEYLRDSGMWNTNPTKKILNKEKPRAIHTKYWVDGAIYCRNKGLYMYINPSKNRNTPVIRFYLYATNSIRCA